MNRSEAVVLLSIVLASALAAPAAATTYVPVADESLVEQAAVVAIVRVRSGGPAAGTGKPAPITAWRSSGCSRGPRRERASWCGCPGASARTASA